jgi:oxygen-dependent protoporphyrinogen oxidase
MPKIAIVGAGISGLSLAYRLHQFVPVAEVTVLEKRDRPGGTVWTEHLDGFQVEVGPNGFLDNKPSTLALCRELGLGDRLVPASEAAARNRYLFLDGKLQLLPNSLPSFLWSGLLSWRGKLVVLSEPLRRRRRDQSDESIDAFVRRRLGREAAEVLADALVTGIHAGDPSLLSVRAAFPRLTALEEQYGSLMMGFIRAARQRRAEAAARDQADQRAGQIWSFREGMRLVIETLCARLPQPPLLGITVRSIRRAGAADRSWPRWVVVGEGQDRWPADAVVLTCPAYQQAEILADLDRELAERIGSIAYNRVAVVALGFRQADVPISLAGFGFIAPQRTRRDLLGVQWCSSIFPERAPPGLVLLRAMCGGWNRPEMVDWDDERLLQALRAELRLSMGISTKPLFHHIVRWDRAIPQYQLGHVERVAWINDRSADHPGLFLAGNAYHGIALNDCTEQATMLAGQVGQFLST